MCVSWWNFRIRSWYLFKMNSFSLSVLKLFCFLRFCVGFFFFFSKFLAQTRRCVCSSGTARRTLWSTSASSARPRSPDSTSWRDDKALRTHTHTRLTHLQEVVDSFRNVSDWSGRWDPRFVIFYMYEPQLFKSSTLQGPNSSTSSSSDRRHLSVLLWDSDLSCSWTKPAPRLQRCQTNVSCLG